MYSKWMSNWNNVKEIFTICVGDTKYKNYFWKMFLRYNTTIYVPCYNRNFLVNFFSYSIPQVSHSQRLLAWWHLTVTIAIKSIIIHTKHTWFVVQQTKPFFTFTQPHQWSEVISLFNQGLPQRKTMQKSINIYLLKKRKKKQLNYLNLPDNLNTHIIFKRFPCIESFIIIIILNGSDKMQKGALSVLY